MHSYLAPQILWDNESQKLYIGMYNKEIAHTWLEYFSCAELLPIPLKIKSAQAIKQPRIRQEIIASCSYQQALDLVVELIYNTLDLNATPPRINRDINQFTRGDVVRILYNDTIGDRRIGKKAIVTQVEYKVNQVYLDVEEHGATWTKPNWILKTGHKELASVIRWESKEQTAWTEYHLIADNLKTHIHIGKCRWKSYEAQLGIPSDKPYAIFRNGIMVGSFENLEQSKLESEILCNTPKHLPISTTH